ncbi:MAG: RNA-binding protein [Alphaproteobacteria bacterium]|nr:RNA-binding protein [Alphaproteobacteria bacterium]
MQAAPYPAHEKPAASESEKTRRCLVTGEVLPKAELIRFVADPLNMIVPDLAQNLPGRGLWVSASREAIVTAVQKNLFAKAAKDSVQAAPDLADQVAQLLRKRCLEFLGLARRAGIAVLGQAQVEEALKKNKLALLLLADDASQPLVNKNSVPEIRWLTRNELGAALGHDQIVYAGLKPHALAGKLESELARLEKLAAPTLSNSGS